MSSEYRVVKPGKCINSLRGTVYVEARLLGEHNLECRGRGTRAGSILGIYKRKRRKESNENDFVEAKGVKHFRKEAMINSAMYSCSAK